jgi:hypothetical protein
MLRSQPDANYKNEPRLELWIADSYRKSEQQETVEAPMQKLKQAFFGSVTSCKYLAVPSFSKALSPLRPASAFQSQLDGTVARAGNEE